MDDKQREAIFLIKKHENLNFSFITLKTFIMNYWISFDLRLRNRDRKITWRHLRRQTHLKYIQYWGGVEKKCFWKVNTELWCPQFLLIIRFKKGDLTCDFMPYIHLSFYVYNKCKNKQINLSIDWFYSEIIRNSLSIFQIIRGK